VKRLAISAVLAALVPTSAGAAVDAFFLQRLQDGSQAYDRRDYSKAIESLRLAAFGMLEDPPILGSTLVRLATAQAAAGDGAGFQSTFGRILELEQRFQVYRGLALEADLRAMFEEQVRKRIAPAVLQAVPAFRDLAEAKPAQAPAAKPPRRRRNEPAPAATAEDLDPPEAAASTPVSHGAPVSEPTPPLAPPPPPVVATSPSEEELATLKRAEEGLASSTNLIELGRAMAAAQSVADRWPSYRPAQLLAGEIAYRSSNWRAAAGYLERASIRPAADPAACFYWAVSLYEIGQAERAAKVLDPCVRHLERTPLVTSYLERIFPTGRP
jgi:hypothetical protein